MPMSPKTSILIIETSDKQPTKAEGSSNMKTDFYWYVYTILNRI